MAEKQLFAKLGVCALLGLNVGGYYAFWPHKDSTPTAEAVSPKTDEAPPRVRISSNEKKSDPTDKAPLELKPLAIVQSPAEAEPDEGSTDALRRLLDHIKKETSGETGSPPPLEGKHGDRSVVPATGLSEPKRLPPLKSDPLAPDPKIGITSPLTPTAWIVRTETAGKQTMLFVRSRLHDIVEFTILCDRINPKTDAGDIVSTGNVVVVGDGITVRCQKVTLPMSHTRLVFEGEVAIMTHRSGLLRSDRFVWELPPDANPSGARPVGLGSPR